MLKKKNSLANRLLQQLPNNKQPNKPTKDIKEFINYKLNALKYTASPFKIEADLLLKDLYLKEFQKIIKWLITLQYLKKKILRNLKNLNSIC